MSDAIILSMVIDLAPLIGLIKNTEYRYLVSAGARFHVLKGAVEHLMHVRDCVSRRVRVAGRRRRRLPEAVRWVEDADGRILAFGELQSDYHRIRKLFFLDVPLDLLSSYRVGKAASQMLLHVNRLCTEGAGIVHKVKLPQPLEILTGYPSRDLTLRAAIARIKEEGNGSVVGIWGRAGLGKTHLLKLIEDYFSRDDSFDLVLRITIPKNCSVAKVRTQIMKKLLLDNCEAKRICHFLKSRNFLLMFDCLHEGLDLEEVGVPSLDSVRSYRQKVVFTSRFIHVCDQMNVELGNRIELLCLDDEESWNTFKHNADFDYLDNQYMFLARNVSRELHGSPLELMTIGKAMHHKDANYWENALDYLSKSCLHETQGSGTEAATFFRLKLGHDSLTDTLKECFKVCSLWPEGHIFDPRNLVDFWIGLGLIQWDNIEMAYSEGFAHISTLQELCLLESAEDGEAVQMHSTIRDFALWVVHNQERRKKKWIMQTNEHWGLAEQVLLVGLELTGLPYIPSNQENLTLLILQDNYLEESSFRNFHLFLSLQYLDLSSNKLSNIPVQICMQVNLRYLNLTNNRIKRVPIELGSLIKLRHLHLRNNPIQNIPNGILLKLQNMEVLDICSFDLLQCSSYEVLFEELQLMSRLRSLGVTVHSDASCERISKTTLPIRALSVVTYDHEDEEGNASKLLSDSPFVNSERRTNLLEFGIYTRKKTIVFDSFHLMWNLEHVEKVILHGYFVNEIKWLSLHPEDSLARLRRLDIVRCQHLNDISWILHLPCLQDLLLFSCSRLHQIIDNVQDSGIKSKTNEKKGSSSIHSTFPRLRRLTLIEADELVSICSSAFTFPSLESLQISACPSLKRLPFLTIPRKLKCIRGENDWWDSLEWENENLESSFEPYFHGLSDEDQLSEIYLFSSLQVEWARDV